MNFDTVYKTSDFDYYETRYPQTKLIDFAAEKISGNYKVQAGVYCLYISPSDHMEGTLQFIAPGPINDISSKTLPYHPMAQALIFHPDLVQDTSLEECLNDCSFFSNGPNQSLHLLPQEYQLVLAFFSNIKMELTNTLDRHSKKLIVSNIELFLHYCGRFLNRKFLVRATEYSSVLQRFDKVLSHYFTSDNPYKFGIPSVAYCAEELHLSANYFGSLVKKETGKTAQEYIRYKLVEEAKHRISNSHKTINEIAYEFGFKYPQHFSRFFKRVVGQNPNEFRNMNLN